MNYLKSHLLEQCSQFLKYFAATLTFHGVGYLIESFPLSCFEYGLDEKCLVDVLDVSNF